MILADIQWWCSAQGVAWSWQWRPYPGVWLFVGLVAVAYVLIRRSAAQGPRVEERFSSRVRTFFFVGGLLLLWSAIDWPIGLLAAGYMATFHQLDLLLIGYLAPVLFLLSLPDSWVARLERHPRLHAAVSAISQPVVAAVLFVAILLTTHLPTVVDGMMASQIGSFGFDLSWLLAGFILWWPVVCIAPRRPRFTGLYPVIYLWSATTPMIIPAAFMTYAPYPLYRVYEFAPRVYWISAVSDQRFGGLLMWIVGTLIFVMGMTILFLRWAADEERRDALDPRPAPAARLVQ